MILLYILIAIAIAIKSYPRIVRDLAWGKPDVDEVFAALVIALLSGAFFPIYILVMYLHDNKVGLGE